MIISKNINDFKGSKPVLTIGFFDGVHLGHAQILNTLTQTAKKLNRKSLVITFWPHPRIVLGNDAEKLKLLTSIKEKQELIEEKQVDGLLIMEFTPEVARISGHDFLQTYLIDNLNVSAVVLGYNHAFGHKGQGNINLLMQHQDKGNYLATQVEPISIDGINISSSKIRAAIETGSISIANAMLGRPYSLTGTIEGGKQLGRSIGYPTANIKPTEHLKQVPGEGVYAVWVDYKGIQYPAMLNIGTRPTIGNGLKQTIEAHIIGFNQNIYDQQITVQFIEKVRDELRFPTLIELKNQLAKDKDTVVKALGV
jgi:riboflavin kinase/FMN adenylyltransferase